MNKRTETKQENEMTDFEKRHIEIVNKLGGLMVESMNKSSNPNQASVNFVLNTVVNLLYPNPGARKDDKDIRLQASNQIEAVGKFLIKQCKKWRKES